MIAATVEELTPVIGTRPARSRKPRPVIRPGDGSTHDRVFSLQRRRTTPRQQLTERA